MLITVLKYPIITVENSPLIPDNLSERRDVHDKKWGVLRDKRLKKKGVNITQIANELGRNRKTIRKWLNEDAPKAYTRTKTRPSKRDPYKDYIHRRVEEGCFNGSVILYEIRALSYTGGGTILRTFMHPLRPMIREKATVRFETAPGEQAQVDWGRVG